MDRKALEEEVLERIVPTREEVESLQSVADRLMAEVREYYRKLDLDVTCVYAGSFPKGTFLSDPDFDLFMQFPPEIPKEDMVEIGLAAGREIIGGELVYSDHPYTTGRYGGVEVDMVPCCRLDDTSKLRTAVDRTPFHTRYMLEHLDPGMRDQVRLLKRFMKGIGTYGAEQEARGFSGYLCEVLIAKYGTFDAVLEASASWELHTEIVLETKGRHIKEPLVVYDPVDPDRNVASAVHEDTMELFKRAAKEYLEDPDVRFFFPVRREPLTITQLSDIADAKGLRIVSVRFAKPDVMDDNLSAQLWKSQYAISRRLRSFGFDVVAGAHRLYDDGMYVVLAMSEDPISETHVHIGPPTNVSNSEQFLARWKGNPYGEPYVLDGRWAVVAERPYRYAKDLLLKETATAGIGRSIDASTMEVMDHDATLADVDPGMLTDLLDPKDPWRV